MPPTLIRDTVFESQIAFQLSVVKPCLVEMRGRCPGLSLPEAMREGSIELNSTEKSTYFP